MLLRLGQTCLGTLEFSGTGASGRAAASATAPAPASVRRDGSRSRMRRKRLRAIANRGARPAARDGSSPGSGGAITVGARVRPSARVRTRPGAIHWMCFCLRRLGGGGCYGGGEVGRVRHGSDDDERLDSREAYPSPRHMPSDKRPDESDKFRSAFL
jgi:hypothetical protein